MISNMIIKERNGWILVLFSLMILTSWTDINAFTYTLNDTVTLLMTLLHIRLIRFGRL